MWLETNIYIIGLLCMTNRYQIESHRLVQQFKFFSQDVYELRVFCISVSTFKIYKISLALVVLVYNCFLVQCAQ